MKNKILVGAVVVLSVLVLLMGAYIIYDKSNDRVLDDANKVIDEYAAKIQELESRPPSVVEVPKEVIPDDYESSKQENAELKHQILKLQEQLEVSPAPVDYDATKRAEVFIKLNTIFELLSSLDDQSQNFIQTYFDDNPDKINLLNRLFLKK